LNHPEQKLLLIGNARHLFNRLHRGWSVMGQQVLNLGYSCEHGFVPLDSEIFISNVKAQGLYKEFSGSPYSLLSRARLSQPL
jgi:hypothetical protein